MSNNIYKSLIMKRLLLFLAFVVTLGFQARSQWQADPALNNPLGFCVGDQIMTKIATHPSGITYVAWFSLESGNYNVRLQKIDAFGKIQWGPEGLLVSSHTSDTWVSDFDMKVDRDTCAVVAFQDIRSGSTEVYAYRVTPDGTFAWGPDGVRLTENTDDEFAPVVAPTDAGNSVIAWQNSGSIQRVGLQKISPQGLKQWGDGILYEGTDNYKFPRLLPAPDDQAYLMWFKQATGLYTPKYLYAQKITANGTAAWTSDLEVASAGGHPMVPDIAFINDPAGGLYICWYDDRNNDWNYSTFVQHIDSSGNALWTTDGVEVIANDADNHMYPGMAVTGDGKDLYVFLQEMDANQNYTGIYGQRLNLAGVVMWETTGKIFMPVGSAEFGMLQPQTSGKNCVLFYLQGPPFGNANLKAMLVDENGDYLWAGDKIDVSSAASAKTDLATSRLSNGQWVAAWSDSRNDNGDIYGQNLTPDGTLGALPANLSLSADSVVYMTYEDCFGGKQLVLRNPTLFAAEIGSFATNGFWPNAMWYIDNPPALPAVILPGDSLVLLIKVTFPVRDYFTFLLDTIHFNSNLGNYSAKIMLNTLLVDEIKDVTAISVQVWPNPFTSTLSINGVLPGDRSATIEISDLSGRLLKQEQIALSSSGSFSYKWEDADVTAGSYFCRIAGSKGIAKSILLIRK